jgi:hypothetical protein
MRGGTPSIGVSSGSTMRMAGTSVAAPAVARLMVLNAARGKDVRDGMGPRPAIHHAEDSGAAIVKAMHKARMGPLTAPPLTR